MSAVTNAGVVEEIADGGEVAVDGAEIEAVAADACGALGCHVQEQLVRLQLQAFGQRVLCPLHAARLIRRERGEADK